MLAVLTGKCPASVAHHSSLFLTQIKSKMGVPGTSLVVQQASLRAPNAGGLGSIPGQGTRTHMHAAAKSSHAATKKSACRNEDPMCCN